MTFRLPVIANTVSLGRFYIISCFCLEFHHSLTHSNFLSLFPLISLSILLLLPLPFLATRTRTHIFSCLRIKCSLLTINASWNPHATLGLSFYFRGYLGSSSSSFVNNAYLRKSYILRHNYYYSAVTRLKKHFFTPGTPLI